MMKTIGLKYSCLLLVLALLALGVSSCSSDDGQEAVTGGGMATLTVNASLVDAAREGMTDIERIHTLRIVILHRDGTVEHNRLVTPPSGPVEEVLERFQVTPGEHKRVLLLANEGSVTGATLAATADAPEEQVSDLSDWLGSFEAGSGGMEEQVSRIMFTPEAGFSVRPIPMTSIYRDVYVSAAENQEFQFYVVRTAVKFTFEFTSMRSDPVTIDRIDISSIADHTWLMPRLDEGATVFGGRNWIEWLKEVSDESQLYPDNTGLADKRGWISDYAIPDVSGHNLHSVPVQYTVPGKQADGTPGQLAGLPAYYCMESRYNGDELSDTQTAAPDEEQIYRVSFKIGNRLLQRSLPNLRALFRNTHVRIKVILGHLETEDAVFARIVDWQYIGYDVNGRLEPED